jgi:hypothetical protein
VGRRVPILRSVSFFLTRRIPAFDRVLLVESGSRELYERFLPFLYSECRAQSRVDLLTCYGGIPAGFDESRGTVYRVTDYTGRPARQQLYSDLCANTYWAIGMLCSGEPIMTKWKWAVAANVPAKVFVINENGDWFWADRSNWRIIRHFVLFRAGLSGAEAVPAIARLLVFPFTLLYLVLYAVMVHLRRAGRVRPLHQR